MNRRDIIKYLSSGLVIPLAPISIAKASESTGRRLILIELSGANDSFNTVIPENDHRYLDLRPSIFIEPNERLALTPEFSLNSALRDLDDTWQSNELAIVHGLGYPDQNRSHFQSIALWETGGDGNRAGENGWLTEDIQGLDGADTLDAHGISLDGGMGVFSGNSGIWLSLTSFEELISLKELSEANSLFNGAENLERVNPALEMIIDRGNSLNTSMERISQKLGSLPYSRSISGAGAFGTQVGMAIQLINAGVNAPVIKLKIGSFDTHGHQKHQHTRLLSNLGRGLSELRSSLKDLGQWDNTLVATYSEFGRRLVENGSYGTDHGTAAAHFVLGGCVTGGFWGDHPDFNILHNGDVEFTMDYRALYHRILADWFGLTNNRFTNYEDDRLSGIIL